jgi:hypothetical protein
MVWKRLPTYLANLRLQLMPLAKEQLEQIKQTGWVKEAAFRTTPNVTKVRAQQMPDGKCAAPACRPSAHVLHSICVCTLAFC